MDTKALKQKILDLAIRGKLVPQDPNDEPASALLERIRAEKQQMVKDGKLKAKDLKNDTVIFVGDDNLHYEKFSDGTVKCIEDEIPYMEPNGWCWCKIDTIAFVTKLAGFEYTKYIAPNLCEHGIPLFKGKNVQNGEIIYEFESFIPEDVSNLLIRSQINRKCILTPYVGTIGNIGIHDREEKYHLGSNVGKIEIYNKNEILQEEYVVAYLRSTFGAKELTKHIKATAQASISIEAIRDVYIPIPPSSEQQRLTHKLNELFNSIDGIDNDVANIRLLIGKAKKSILELAIKGKLVPQDPNDEPASILLERIRKEKEELIGAGKIKRDKRESVIFRGEDNSYYEKFSNGEIKCINDKVTLELPNGWGWCRLRDLFTVSSSKRVLQSDWCSSGVPFYRAREIVKLSENGTVDNELFISVEHYKKITEEYGVPQAGDLMVSGVGTIGKVYIVQDTDKFYYKDASVLCFQNRTGFVNPDFARFMLESEFIQRQMKNNSYGTTVDTITISSAMDYLCMLPPVEEQQRIVKSVKNIAKKLSYIEWLLSVHS